MGSDGVEDAQAKDAVKPPGQSRRKFLRLIALAGLGGAVAVFVPGLLVRTAASSSPNVKQTQTLASGWPASKAGSATQSSIEIRAKFFQMSQDVPVTQDTFVVQSPAQYSDLLGAVETRYPKISTMVPTMMALVDGVPVRTTTPLRDGDEVDFVPTIVGG